MPKVCPRCGSLIREAMRFCDACGAPLDHTGKRVEGAVNYGPYTQKKTLQRKHLLLIAAVIVVLFLAGLGSIGYLLTQSSLSVQSDPVGAGVYLDSEFRGVTPSIMHNLMPGEYRLEFRHDGYPPWQKNITVALGQAQTINADLSENLIPNVEVVCFSEEMLQSTSGATSCIYTKGEALTLSGTAIRPHPKENPNVTLSLYSQGAASPFKIQSVAIRPDNSYNLTVDGATVPSGDYRLVASLPSGQKSTVVFSVESQDDTNIRILRQIVEDYHKIHTYSLEDYFICADMAQDVWNIVETRGMRAVLVAGNTRNTTTDWKEYNHAWVIVEAAPRQWVALETTGGVLVYKKDNPNYYQGTFFAGPKDLKTDIDLRRDYNNELVRYSPVVNQYNERASAYNTELDNYHSLVNAYNSKYTGQNLTATEYQESLGVKNTISSEQLKLGQLKTELDQLSVSYNNEKQVMDGITTQMNELVAKGMTLMNS
jgi:hypothetical protein